MGFLDKLFGKKRVDDTAPAQPAAEPEPAQDQVEAPAEPAAQPEAEEPAPAE